MYEVTLKTAKNNKIWMVLAVSITIVLAFAGGKQVVNGAFAANSSSSEKVDVGSVVEAAVVKITSGDFDAAGDLISTVKGSSDPRALQLGRIIDEYKSFSKERQDAKAKSYEEMLADLKGEGPKDAEDEDGKEDEVIKEGEDDKEDKSKDEEQES
jgi:hypothetical protein